jgi:hypothetical protein
MAEGRIGRGNKRHRAEVGDKVIDVRNVRDETVQHKALSKDDSRTENTYLGEQKKGTYIADVRDGVEYSRGWGRAWAEDSPPFICL